MTICYNNSPDKEKDKEKDNQLYICTEIAAAESIQGLEYDTPKATQR